MENQGQLKFTKTRFFIIFFLILIGIGMCIDLGYIFWKTNFHNTFAPSFCAVSDLIDCDVVARTNCALTLGVPNALWGLILYVVMLMLLFVDRIQMKFKNTIFDVFKNPRSYISFLGLLSFAISILLACISIFKIEKICVLCFATYFINFFIAIVAKNEKGYLYDFKTTFVDFIAGAKKYFILFIIVLIAFISTLWYLETSTILSPYLKEQKLHQKEQQYQRELFESKINKYATEGNLLGKENAKVVINLYSDYNCPFCKVAHAMLHRAAKEYNIKVNEINFPLDTRCNPTIGHTLGGHESSCIYSQFAIAAKKQGKFWGVADTLFYTHPASFDIFVAELEKRNLGIDYEQLKKDANSPEVLAELKEDIELSLKRGINATPSIEINGNITQGVPYWSKLKEMIEEAQKQVQKEEIK